MRSHDSVRMWCDDETWVNVIVEWRKDTQTWVVVGVSAGSKF